MKYRIGQKVKIKDFKELAAKYGTDVRGNVPIGNIYFARPMKVYCGEEYKIIDTNPDYGIYELDLRDGGDWYFTEEMFEGDEEPKTEIKKKGRSKK